MDERQTCNCSTGRCARTGHPRKASTCLVEGEANGRSHGDPMSGIGVGPVFSSYAHLVEMLGEGWQLEPPVYVRPRWRSSLRVGKDSVYHFVLWCGGQVRLVSVLGCPEIEQFLLDRELAVDRL